MIGFNRELTHRVGIPVRYSWRLGEETADVNSWLGRQIEIRFEGDRRCIACGRKVKKLYQNGYCFPCVTQLAETDLCIVRPDQCHFAAGTCRDESYAMAQCMVPHHVYLSVSSQVKVGVTRKNRELVRWVDQGATQAMVIAELPTRKQAGELESAIAARVPDKTDWRKMVRGSSEKVDLIRFRDEIAGWIDPVWLPFFTSDCAVVEIGYPVLPDAPVKALSLSAEPSAVSGRLVGVRGQYLLLESGVFNVRRHAGLLLAVEVG